MRLNRLWLSGLLALVTAGLVNCAPSAASRNVNAETLVVTRAVANKAGFSVRWQRQIGLTNNEAVQDVWRVGDSIYVSTTKNQLHRLSAAEGTTTWQADMGKMALRVYRPVEQPGGKFVYVLTRGRIYALDKRLGDVVSSSELRFAATCDPVATEDTLCVGGANKFYGLYYNPLAGEKWITSAPNDYFRARPAMVGNAMYLASLYGKIWRISPRDGVPDWRDRKTNGECLAPLTADANRVFIPCMDRRLYCFDAGVGTPLWDTRLDGKLDQQAMIVGGNVLCVGTDKGLYCLATKDGEIKWTMPGVQQLVAKSGDRVFASDASGALISVSVDGGTVEGRLPLQSIKQFVQNEYDGIAYAVTTDGRVAALEATR